MTSLFIILLSVATARSQALYVGSEQLISVGEGAVVQLSGSMENEGTLWNQGELYVNGNWQNSARFLGQNGLTVFSGTTQQLVSHNEGAFAQLRLENASGINLTSDISIEQGLELLEGRIEGEAGVRIFLGPDAVIDGGSETAYVDAVLVHRGTGDKFFPLGTEDQYLPLELLDIRGSDPQVSLEAISPHPEAGSLVGLDKVTNTHYWQLRRMGGTFEDARVRIQLRGVADFEDNTGLVVAAAQELGGEYISLGGTALTGNLMSGSVTSEDATDFPIISLGKSNEYSVEGEVLVPNAFAPDSPVEADRRLSVFAVNLLPEPFVFRIFDRWGQMVYQTTSLDEALNSGWDGINRQTNQPAQWGVYSYYMRGVFSSGIPVEKKGTLTLFL